ncbi:Palmitoyl-protein thioesterase 1, partial [Coemansia erecta]
MTKLVDDEAVARANELKLEANALFAQKKYHEAIEKYSEAIKKDPTVPAFYTNRAQCHILTEGYGAAKQDADAALDLDSSFIKAYFRRATALLAMGQLKEARADFREVTSRAPGDVIARKKYMECDKLFRRIQFEQAIDSDVDRKRVADTIDLNNYPVPEDYEGPRMPVRKVVKSNKDGEEIEIEEEYVDRQFVEDIAEWFREQKTLPVRYMYVILMQVDNLLRGLPTLVDVKIPSDAVMTVCGDVHGQYYDVLNIFKLNGFPSEQKPYLFNGDF